MNYICYNETTGRIIETGYSEPEYINHVYQKGYPVILVDTPIDYRTHKVDVVLKTVIPMTEEEIIGPLLPPPVVISPPPETTEQTNGVTNP